MHRYEMSEKVRQRVLRRMGKLHALDRIDAVRTALVVIDMQNYFCAEGHPAEVPAARAIVPSINRLAAGLRKAGGTVVWVQTAAQGALERWRNYHLRMLTDESRRLREEGLRPGSEGFQLLRGLEPRDDDQFVVKIMYSAFISGSADIDARLRARGVDTILVAGTLTNVCCESTARDAMMLDYKVAMVSDANATLTAAEHVASLDTFAMHFGDVLTTDEIVERLR